MGKNLRTKEYGLGNCVGEGNLMKAIDQHARNGFTIHSVVWRGTAEVLAASPAGIIGSEKKETVNTYLLVMERDFIPEDADVSLN